MTISFLGRYSTQHIIDFYKAKLKSMPCQNQGFVLDGFPKTEEEAKELFAREFHNKLFMKYHLYFSSRYRR